MYDKTIQQALGHVSDAYLESAMGVYERKRKARKRWHRVAVCAAVLAVLLGSLLFWPNTEESYITGPGMFTVRAHAVDTSGNASVESVVLEEGVEFASTVVYDPTKSYRQHFPFSFSIDENLYPDMVITMEVNTNAGIFYKNDPFDSNMLALPPILQIFNNHYGQHFTVSIDKKLYWQPEGFDYEYMAEQIKNGNRDFNSAYKAHDYAENPSYIDVIIRADDYIVGYCVIAIREFNENDGHPDREFSFEVLTIVSFPKMEGKLQNVTFKYVQEEINRIHREGEELAGD